MSRLPETLCKGEGVAGWMTHFDECEVGDGRKVRRAITRTRRIAATIGCCTAKDRENYGCR